MTVQNGVEKRLKNTTRNFLPTDYTKCNTVYEVYILRYFDLHCDTLTEAYQKHEHLVRNHLQVSFDRANAFEDYCQLFAVFIPDELRDQQALDYFLSCASYFDEEIRLSGGDPATGKINPHCRAMLSVEGGSACGGTLEGLQTLFDCGVRVMTLTWNGDNEIASGCFSLNDHGLTDFGKEVISQMSRLGMIPDVSHLGKKSFAQLAQFYDGVFIASHSNYDLTANPYGRARNLSDWQVREIVSRGGLIGINFCPDFLGDPPGVGYDHIMKQIESFLALDAEKCLAIGSDFDGCTPIPDVNSISRIPFLYQALLDRGLPGDVADRLFWQNAFSFFQAHFPDK